MIKPLLLLGITAQMLLAQPSAEWLNEGEFHSAVEHKEKRYYKISVDAKRALNIKLTNLTADIDLYVAKSRLPSIRDNDCYSANSSTKNEECTVTIANNPSIDSQNVYILVYGFKEGAFVITTTRQDAEYPDKLTLGEGVQKYIKLNASKDFLFQGKKNTTYQIDLNEMDDDADLRVKVGKKATKHTFDCKSTKGGKNEERCIIKLKNDNSIYMNVFGYREANYQITIEEVKNAPITIERLKEMIMNDEDLTKVNTSEITDMSYMFSNEKEFNQDISGWDVSNVTNMEGMFYKAYKFNQPIGKWDVSNVTNMADMFHDAREFNQPIGNWNVSKVTTMKSMFTANASTIFNQPIGNWDVSNVRDMSMMFYSSSQFNQPLESWNVSNVNTMQQMFNAAYSFNQPIANWDVSNVTNMRDMFSKANKFNQPVEKWNVSNVTDMDYMFYSSNLKNNDLSKWNVKKVQNHQDFFTASGGNNTEPKWNN